MKPLLERWDGAHYRQRKKEYKALVHRTPWILEEVREIGLWRRFLAWPQSPPELTQNGLQLREGSHGVQLVPEHLFQKLRTSGKDGEQLRGKAGWDVQYAEQEASGLLPGAGPRC